MKKLWILLCFCNTIINAQNPDSVGVLTYDDFLRYVSQNHPIAQQIRLQQQRAEQQLQFAKGNFDPQLGGQWDYKSFDGKNYYSVLNTYLKIPTWIGVGVDIGYAHNTGQYLNPENKLPKEGQAYMGLNIPLLQGLITDERRTAVQQARVLQNQTEAEIRAALNDLLYDAALAYWDWALVYSESRTLQRYVAQAQTRFEAVRTAYQAGDRPAIDTLEAFLRVQDRQLGYSDARLRLRKAAIYLSNFLWDSNQTPQLLPFNAAPEDWQQGDLTAIDSLKIDNWLSDLPQSHPLLLGYQYQMRQLELEQKLKQNKILPKLEFKYNFLSNTHVDFWTGNAFVENYKFGAKLSMPILLRQERAGLKMTLLKQQETLFKQNYKAVEIANKIRAYSTEVNALVDINQQAQSMFGNYLQLLSAEQEKFMLGESSVFLINAREDKVIEAQLKLLQTRIKYLRAQTSLQWALGGQNNK